MKSWLFFLFSSATFSFLSPILLSSVSHPRSRFPFPRSS